MAEQPKRVLIVDDEEDLTWTLSRKLSKDRDKFEVICVNSGRDAFNVLNQLPIDLMISDVRMPEISGLELLVKTRELYPDTKVVIMTAYGSSDVQKEATERGCFHYIEKPFEINELRQLIIDSITRKKGFKGSVSDFQLSDIIQLNCLGRLTSALKVKCEGEEGFIFFQEGNIVHAETGHLEGEAAFYHIMNWQGGEFVVLRHHSVEQETIRKGWQSLLLEGLHRADENSALAREQVEREKQERNKQLNHLLGKLYKAEGIEHVFLHTRVGFPLHYLGSFSKTPEKINNLGNRLAVFLENFSKNADFLQGGPLGFWEFHLEKRVLMTQKIPGEDTYLTIIGKANVNSGYIRLEIKKNLNQLIKLL